VGADDPYKVFVTKAITYKLGANPSQQRHMGLIDWRQRLRGLPPGIVLKHMRHRDKMTRKTLRTL
jgi:hypothetical protein